MFHRSLASGVVSFISIFALAAGDSTTNSDRPTSSAAVSALKEYEKTTQAAEDAWKLAKANAEKKLIEKLKLALPIATKAGNLAEANSINAQIKLATEHVESGRPAGVVGGSIVERAMYTPKDATKKAKDVTQLLKPCIKGKTLLIKNVDLGDPDPERGKVLVIDGVLGGVPFTIQLPDGGVNGFSIAPFQPGSK